MSDIYLVDSNIWVGHEMAYPDAVSYIDNELIAKGKTIAMFINENISSCERANCCFTLSVILYFFTLFR